MGSACSTLAYAVTPAGGENLWTGNSDVNTWSSPILRDPEGLYHLYDPIFAHKSLYDVLYVAHGVASCPTGPYDWTRAASINSTGFNPGGLIFPNATSGEPVYSLWVKGGDILVSSSAFRPFVVSNYSSAPNTVNVAPLYNNGNFYMFDVSIRAIWMTPSLDKPWVKLGEISHANTSYAVEDAFLYADLCGNFHINHAYKTSEKVNCSLSVVSSHFFRADGLVWGHTDQPYGHTVEFDDGTSHSYCTLERPNLLFDEAGDMSHIHFAADLITQD